MPNKIYQIPETAISWLASGGTALFTCTSLAAGGGRQGALHDFGVSARPAWYAWRAFIQFGQTPVLGEALRIYWKTSDGTHPDNDDGTGDAAVSAVNKLNNLRHIGNIRVDEAAINIEMVASGVLWIPHRYGAPVFWNGTADALTGDAAEHGFILTPMPGELQ